MNSLPHMPRRGAHSFAPSWGSRSLVAEVHRKAAEQVMHAAVRILHESRLAHRTVDHDEGRVTLRAPSKISTAIMD